MSFFPRQSIRRVISGLKPDFSVKPGRQFRRTFVIANKKTAMIADASMLANSPWQSDTWLARDSCLGSDLEECDSLSQLQEHFNGNPTVGHSASCSSKGGSECSDDLGLDELPWRLDDNDIMQHTMMNLLGDAAPNSPESDYVVSLDSTEHLSPKLTSTSPLLGSDYSSLGTSASQSSNDDSLSTHSSTIPSCPPSPHIIRPKSKSRKPRSHDYRKWSEMSAAGQMSLVEELTAAISQQLGLREQLEVISIIKPDVALTAGDTEFAIELSWLNEKKLKLVYEYLEKHKHSTDSKTSKSDKTHHHKSSKPESHGRSKRKQRSRMHQESKREKKEHQQLVKEERSGLFREEQVLSLAASSRDEDEEVDILT